MKIKGFIAITCVTAMVLGSCVKSTLKNTKLKTQDDSLSYAFGILNYNALLSDSLILNPIIVAKAMQDAKDEKPIMQDNVARMFIMNYFNTVQSMKAAKQVEKNKIKYKDYIEVNKAFLEKNKEKQGVIVTSSGLQYEVIKMGKGAKPTLESTVKVHYTGTLIDGTEFDSSVKRNEPATFPVSRVIAGWTEALQLMPVGSKFKLVIPESIAYGANPPSDIIKPFSTLIFEVELLEIVN